MDRTDKGRKTKKRKAPFSIRLSFDERARLERQAGDMPLGAYVKARVLDGAEPPRRKSPQPSIADRNALAQVLAKLGSSRLSNNVNQLARAANSGSLPVTPETGQALNQACADIAEMKALLMNALGARPPKP